MTAGDPAGNKEDEMPKIQPTTLLLCLVTCGDGLQVGAWSCPERFEDLDGDGFGGAARFDCSEQATVDIDGDCDDADENVHPDAADACDGIDRDCDGAWDNIVPTVCPTIQAAVDIAPEGGRVDVLAGTYHEHVVLRGKNITLHGAAAATTIIDGDHTGRPLTIQEGEGPATVIENFTLQNGYSPTDGGGVFIAGASPVLRRLILQGNKADGGGGGLWAQDSELDMEDIEARENRATGGGGGMYTLGGGVNARSLWLHHNVAEGAGGGRFSGNAVLESVVAEFNHAYWFGGVRLFAAPGETVTLRGAVVRGNTVEDPPPEHQSPFDHGFTCGVDSTSQIDGKVEMSNLIVHGNKYMSDVFVAWCGITMSGGGEHVLSRSTIAGESADGVVVSANAGPVLLEKLLVFRNLGHGVFVQYSPTVSLVQVVLDENPANLNQDCDSAVKLPPCDPVQGAVVTDIPLAGEFVSVPLDVDPTEWDLRLNQPDNCVGEGDRRSCDMGAYAGDHRDKVPEVP